MAKKKTRKGSKQVEVAGPSDDPTPASDLVPALPEAPPTLSEEATTKSNPDDSVQPIAAPTESTVEDPVVEVPTIEPASEDTVAKDATIVEQEGEAEVPVDDIVETKPAIEHEVAEEPAEAAVISQETSDTPDSDLSPVHHIPAPVATEQPETIEEAPLEHVEVEPSTAEEIILEPVEVAPEPQSKPVEEVGEPLAVPENQPEPIENLEESVVVEPQSQPEEPVVEPAPEVESVEADEEHITALEPQLEAGEIIEPAPEPQAESEQIHEPEISIEPVPQVEEIPVPEPQAEDEEIPKPEILTVPEPEAEVEAEENPKSEPKAEDEYEKEDAEIPEPETLAVPEPEVEAGEIPEPKPQAEEASEPEILAVPELEAEEISKPEILAVPEVQSETKRFVEPEPKPESPATSRATSPAHNTFSSIATTVEMKVEPPREQIHEPSPKRSQPHLALTADELSISSPPPVERKSVPEFSQRPAEPMSLPRPLTIARVIEDDRPPAPTPPVGRYRPRNAIAFDSDDSDDQSVIQPRLRGDRPDPARAPSYPPQSSHPRSLFASRVPPEHYSPPSPQPAPPGYHPRYYPPPAQHYPPVPPQYQHGSQHLYNNNNMSQNGGYPNPGQYHPPSHGSSSYQESWGQMMPTYPPYGSPQRQDSVGSREYPMGPPSLENGSSTMEDDTGDVFSRIAQAIPDLHVLLAKYKETHGQFSMREDQLRRAGMEQQEQLKNKDEEMYHLRQKMSNMEAKHSSDASRLRLEIGNMDEQMKELREQIAETEKFKKEARETRLALAAAKVSWEARCNDLEYANAVLEKTALEERANAQRDFDNWRSTASTRHDAEKIALAIQFDKKLKEADASFVKEKDELISDHQRQQLERESDYDSARKELEIKLNTAQRDREDALIHERESREVWEAERETLARAYDEERESLQRGWDEQRESLEGQYRKNKEESDKAWVELHADAARNAEEEKAKVARLTEEKDLLQREYNALKAESRREKEVIKSVAGNLETERARLEKLMECYGDIAEIKSKGDTYYSVSFAQLQRQIIDLATTHFVHLPVSPPPDDLAQIPSGLPSFLGDTMASRQLRAVYITHTVAKMITYRVFGPFLFSLGRRYDKADSLFSSMSSHIRDKSTRKEAIWRQQTLLAAFTSSGAKQRINTAAGTVVDEIIVAIKNFADPKEEEGIRIAVKRIVKLAAETWRFARLEREMITATMPALQDEEHSFNGLEYWPPVRPEGTAIPSPSGNAGLSDESTKILLRLFPVIYREPKHENFQSADQESADVGCIYHHGLALYDDAEPVVKRSEELRHAGLPPVANSPPTAADFPPPMIPPPRNALPRTPGVSGDTSTKNYAPLVPSISSVAPSLPAEYTRHLMSDLSIPPYKRHPDAEPIKSTTAPTPLAKPAAMKRTTLPPMSDLSIPPYIPQSERSQVRSTKAPPPAIKRHHRPQMSDLSIPPYMPRSEVASIVSGTPPPPESLPSPDEPLECPNSPALTMFDLASRPYTRPISGQVNQSNSRDAPSNHFENQPRRPQRESAHIAGPFRARQYPDMPNRRTTAPSHSSNNPPLPIPTDLSSLSPRPYTRDLPRPPIPTTMDLSHMDDESAIIPPLFSRRNSTISASVKDNTPTPSAPGSRAVTPPSPLGVAEDEIDSLSTFRNRNPALGTPRRSTPGHISTEELRKEAMRRTSVYAISNRSSMEGSIRTERTDRSGLSTGSNSRYMCDHKSAAMKALYPNSPMIGTPEISRTNSLRSSGKRSVADKSDGATGAGASGTTGTWDTSTASANRTKDSSGGTEAAWDSLTANGKKAKESVSSP